MEHVSELKNQDKSIQAAWIGKSKLTIPRDQILTVSETKQALLAFCENVPWGIILLDEQGKLTYGNQVYWKWLGNRQEFINVQWLTTLEPEERPQIQQMMQEMKKHNLCVKFDFHQRSSNEKVLRFKAQAQPCFYEDAAFFGTFITLQVDYEKIHEPVCQDHDQLTGLPNRLNFYSTLEQKVQKAEKNGESLALIILDIDRFKRINETFGHERGDSLLVQVAERLVSLFSANCSVFRLGGDEFIILVEQFNQIDEICKYGQMLLRELSKLFLVEDVEFYITASVGISVYPTDGSDGQTLMKNADTAMYRAKEHGKNNFQFYRETMNSRCIWTFAMENRLRKAIQQTEFLVYYQPQMSIDKGNISGIEALVRWLHPEVGLISPAEFIPLAEESGLICHIGKWVMKTACTQLKAWHNAGFKDLRVSVNISPIQFQQPELISWITKILEETKVDPQYLELEITESLLMQNPESSRQILNALSGMGLHLSVDDFGTGYSSLSYLKHFPINTIKIDRTFVNGITSHADDQAIATAVTRMAHSLNMTVVAEGVETEEQLHFLQSIGCDAIQGYLFSRPISAAQFTDQLHTRWINLCNRPI